MKRIITALVFSLGILASCEKYETVKEVNTDFATNYEAFWTMVNEQYCFLGESFGNDKNVDWQAVYDKWMPIVKNEVKDEYELFNIMSQSLDVLKDGHIWMISDFKTYSNTEYRLKSDGITYYEENFVKNFVQNNYLNKSTGKDDYKGDQSFKTRNGVSYGTIEREGKKIAYIYYGSFSTILNDFDFKYLDPLVKESDALIFDIRNNPGGSGSLGIEYGGMFMKEELLVGYSAHKDGSGHDDFTEPYEMYCAPSEKYDWSDKQTALLTNINVYSTANLFTSILKHAPNVVQVGQKSGGGGGLPLTHYLPNGWLVVFPSNILLDVNKKHIEPGIEPDIEAEMGDYQTTGKDGIVERAIEELLKKI